MAALPRVVAALLLVVCASGNNSTDTDSCALGDGEGPWSELLQEWALTAPVHSDRQGRIMALPPAQGYYVTDRVDRPPPPPPAQRYGPQGSYGPQAHAPGSQGSYAPQGSYRPQGSNGQQESPSQASYTPQSQGPQAQHGTPFQPGQFYQEWQASPPPPPDSKIVNRPTNPNKDKFKPSYQSPPASQQIPAHPPHQRPSAVDRIGEAHPTPAPSPPQRKQVSETDLYLLSAIEKLVWRVDLMEKRLRKMEDSMHYLVVGAETKPEPCVSNFTRVGGACYHVSGATADWKSANLQCRKLRANLLEMETETERRTTIAALLGDKRLRGLDVWTGGLNPGLLWIWSHSARPVAGNASAPGAGASNDTAVTIVGEGRCLALIYDPTINNYVYRGQDCQLRHRFICEKEEDRTQLSNEIERVARALRIKDSKEGKSRKTKIMWETDD